MRSQKVAPAPASPCHTDCANVSRETFVPMPCVIATIVSRETIRVSEEGAGGLGAGVAGSLFAPSDALALAFALAFALALATPFAKVALADDGNEVNPQQLPDSSFIYDTSIADLAGADAYYNDQTVQVVGEVVGDAINVTLDGTHKWITLEATSASGASGATSASGATITVFMTSDAAERIDTFGAYGKTGTILQVRGTFHLACREHDGLTDLYGPCERGEEGRGARRRV